jgi:hypothetical protein
MSHTEMVGLRIVENTGKSRLTIIQSGIIAPCLRMDVSHGT